MVARATKAAYEECGDTQADIFSETDVSTLVAITTCLMPNAAEPNAMDHL